jgi:peptidoglycan LD-endopeptidase LytH
MHILEQIIEKNRFLIQKVVDFDPKHDQLLGLDFTFTNTELTDEILGNINLFSAWVDEKLSANDARYGIGGYNEHRTIYSRSAHFDAGEEPRRLHLGVDIWGAAGTPVYNFYDASVHSFAYNDNLGDYGATIILAYDIAGYKFHALYGHLSLNSLNNLEEGMQIKAGTKFAELGNQDENGCWPPHLHFQLIENMEGVKGDYPGVCKFSDRKKYLSNCPDPEFILRTTFS